MTRRPPMASPQEYRDPAVGGRRKAIEETVGGAFVLAALFACVIIAGLFFGASVVPG